MSSLKALPSGKVIDLTKPNEYTFTVEEIGANLSKLLRFSGYGVSVAEHSVKVAHTLYSLTKNPHIALVGLLHDSAEAYIGDICTPLKSVLGEAIDKVESGVLNAIYKQLGVKNTYNLATQTLVKMVDVMALHFEYNNLRTSGAYKHNELWEPIQKVPVHPSMFDSVDTSFVDAYQHYRELAAESIEFEEVPYQTNQGIHSCYVAKGHDMEWLK